MSDLDAIEAQLRGQGDADQSSLELARRFAEAAAASGDAEVAFATLDTPVGRTSVAATPRGIVSVGLPNHPLDDFVERLATQISPRVVEAPGKLDLARRELSEFFEGDRRDFDLALDWTLVPGGFYRKVLDATAKLGYGEVMTYGEIARSAGNPRAHRAAGTALGANPLPIVVPCHRIVRAGKDPGNYGGGPELKRWLLELEGSLPT
ncbi:MAG: methylated-DNA-[protein]-cysteine S-methyltransferase [Solirubrobacterales bacterium]|jgi:methylated-DNA-[protein]-cysteine S-methyltransferase|nr:methylated-DNA-[protein]-cysteine S-methyltransferase [Solirubrobacterales bacterium]